MAKVVYFCINDIATGAYGGGALFSRRNVEMLQQIYGLENVEVCVFSSETITAPLPPHFTVFPRTHQRAHAFFSAIRGFKIIYPHHMKKVLNFVDEVNPDIVFFDSSVLGKLIRKIKCRDITVVTFSQNVEKDYAWNKVIHQGLIYLFSYWASVHNEKIAMRQSDVVIALNERDAARLHELYGRNADGVLPITLEDRYEEKRVLQTGDAKKLLFCGMLFAPNLDAVRWLVNEIMPLLPGFFLQVVGRNFETHREELNRDNVEIVGSVEDIDAYFYSHPAVIMPVRYGGGMKVKTAEAMMFGRAIFATNEALEGYDVDGVEGIYRCNTPEVFAQSIKSFFSTEVLNVQNAVRSRFLEKYDTQNQLKKFQDILKKSLQNER